MRKLLLWLSPFLLVLVLLILNAGSFDVVPSTREIEIYPGGSGSFTVVVKPQGGFKDDVLIGPAAVSPGVILGARSVKPADFGKPIPLEIRVFSGIGPGKYRLAIPVSRESGLVLRDFFFASRKTIDLTVNVLEGIPFLVDTNEDTIDAAPGDGVCADRNGRCSLRAAVMEANAQASAVTIRIPAGIYRLVRSSLAPEQGGDLKIGREVTLKGAGADSTVLLADNGTRVLTVLKDGAVSLEGLTIRGGQADLGGGIYNEGWLSITKCTIRDNKAQGGGGGIYSTGTLNLTGSTVMNNTARDGGGIATRGDFESFRSRILNNVAQYNGGGLHHIDGKFTLIGTTIRDNRANNGGGIFDSWSNSEMKITLSDISGNRASESGGGITVQTTLFLERSTVSGNTAEGSGGGIYSATARVDLVGSIIARNVAGVGGGIASMHTLNLKLDDTNLESRLAFSTIVDNKARRRGGGLVTVDRPPFLLKGTILAGNTDSTGRSECIGPVRSAGYNLIGGVEGCSLKVTPTDILGQDPQVAPKMGERRLEYPPQPGSPVLKRVPRAECTDFDGKPAEGDGPCDIGASTRWFR